MGRSKLAQLIIGPWAKAPKKAREDYDGFVLAMSNLLGGGERADELQAASAAVWDILRHAPSLSKGPVSVIATKQLRFSSQSTPPACTSAHVPIWRQHLGNVSLQPM